MVTASSDNTARVWELSGPTPVSTVLAGHTGQVWSASFSPDGKRVVTASSDKTARVWELSGPTPVSTVLAGHTGPVWSASFSPDGQRVVTASSDNTARVWELTGPPPVHRARRPHRYGRQCVVESGRAARGDGVLGQDGAGMGADRADAGPPCSPATPAGSGARCSVRTGGAW